MSLPVVVVGGGMAGLGCALELERAGLPWELHEASARLGGRVGGRRVDDFTIDHGFQVLLDGYREVRRALELDALDLRAFAPGARIRVDGRFVTVADPLRRPTALPATLAAGIFGARDLLALARLRFGAPARAKATTRERLRGAGLGSRAIDLFFAPFLGGVFLERELETPAAMFDFVFGHFARGRATLPAGGMQALADALVAKLPAGRIHRGSRVAASDADGVTLADGRRVPAAAVVLAVEGEPQDEAWNGTVQLAFDAPRPPLAGPWLVLAGETDGPVNHLAVPSEVAAGYAPEGRALVSANVLGRPRIDDGRLEGAVRAQLGRWFGVEAVAGWRTLAIDRIPRALPRRFARGDGRSGEPRASDGRYRCGDRLETPSIDGALSSGRRAADAVRDDLAARGGAS